MKTIESILEGTNPFGNEKDFGIVADWFYAKYQKEGLEVDDYDIDNERLIEDIEENLATRFDIQGLAYQICGYCCAKARDFVKLTGLKAEHLNYIASSLSWFFHKHCKMDIEELNPEKATEDTIDAIEQCICDLLSYDWKGLYNISDTRALAHQICDVIYQRLSYDFKA